MPEFGGDGLAGPQFALSFDYRDGKVIRGYDATSVYACCGKATNMGHSASCYKRGV